MERVEPAEFEQTFLVEASHIDDLGHVNNVVYLAWVQEVAGAHWRAVATPEQVEAIAWVATRHEIEYDRPAFEGDRILARTWVESWTAVRSERRTEIFRQGEDLPLVRARTSWCSLDATTMKPRRMPADVSDRFMRRIANDGD